MRRRVSSDPVHINAIRGEGSPNFQNANVFAYDDGNCSSGGNSGKQVRADRARSFYNRVRWDVTMQTDDYVVGWIKSKVDLIRKSGAEAWSSRVQDTIVEDTLDDFESKSRITSRDQSIESSELPFWRILYFKNLKNDAIVWGQQSQQLSCTPEQNESCSPKSDSSSAQRSDSKLLRFASYTSPASDADCERESLDSHSDSRYKSLPWLPDSIWHRILHFCGNRELAALEEVCTDLKDLIRDSNVWKAQYKRTFGIVDEKIEVTECRESCLASERSMHHFSEASICPLSAGDTNTSVAKLCGSHALTACGANIRVWDHVSDRRLGMLSGHSFPVTALDFCDEVAVSGDTQGGVKIWNLEEMKLTRGMKMHGGRVTGAVVLNSSSLATCATDGLLKIFDVSSGNSILTSQAIDEDRYTISCMSLISNKTLVVGDAGGQIWTFDVESGSASPSFMLGGQTISALSAAGISSWKDASSPIVAACSGDMVHLVDYRSRDAGADITLFCDILLEDCESVSEYSTETPVVDIFCEANELIVATDRKVSVFDIRAARSANGATWRSSATPCRASLMVDDGIECMAVSKGRVLLGTKKSCCLLWDSVNKKDLGQEDKLLDEGLSVDKYERKKTRKPKTPKLRGRYPKRQTK